MGCGHSKRGSATLDDEYGAANGDGGAQPTPCPVEPFVQTPELLEVMRKWTRVRGPSAHTRAAPPVPTGKPAAARGPPTPRVTGEGRGGSGKGGDTSVRRGAITPRYTGPYPTVEELDMESRRLQDAMRALQREAHALDVGSMGTATPAALAQSAAAGAVPEAGAAAVSTGSVEAPPAGEQATHISPKEAEAAPARLTTRLTALLAQIQEVEASAASFSTPAVASRA